MLHGGGNTSVKTKATDLAGDEVEVLCVKGSGWDMGDDRARRPARRAARRRCLKLRARDKLSDEDMVRMQRANLLDPGGAQSVGRDAAARLPAAQIRRPHAFDRGAAASPTSRTARRCAPRSTASAMGYVPYIMPGFALAKKAAEVFERIRRSKG